MGPSRDIVAVTETFCRADGLVGKVTSLSFDLPHYVWSVKTCMALVRGDIYLLFFSLGYYYERLLNWVLQDYFADPRPNPHCSAELGFPSFEAQISYMFVGFSVGHLWLWHERLQYSSWIYLFILTVYVPFILVFNGMNTVSQVCAGALLGFVGGITRVYFYKYFLHPYSPCIARFDLFRWFKYENDYFRKLRGAKSKFASRPHTCDHREKVDFK